MDWERVLAVNLTGYFNVLKSTVARMSRPGSVIQVASIQGHTGVAFPSYTASKGAILSLSRQLGAELGPDGIRVNSVSPGMILTGMTQDSLSQDDARNAVAGRTPLRRVGNAADIANAILYLASDFSGFVTSADLFGRRRADLVSAVLTRRLWLVRLAAVRSAKPGRRAACRQCGYRPDSLHDRPDHWLRGSLCP